MKGPDLHRGIRTAAQCLQRPIPSRYNASRPRPALPKAPYISNSLSTFARRQAELEDIKAAPEVDMEGLSEDGEMDETEFERVFKRDYEAKMFAEFERFKKMHLDHEASKERFEKAKEALLRRIRIVPASPSYFTAKPSFTDDFLALQALLRKYQTLPVMPPGHAPRVAWKALEQYKDMVGSEPVKAARYHRLVEILQRLNYINTELMPQEVADTLERYKRDINPHLNVAKPHFVDEHGRALGVGRLKTSTARAYLVEGEGEVLINGKSLTQFFGRVHDRESAVWALKATERVDKYNVFALVNGGGVTGQAEALTLAVAKALMVHEPLLKPALRRGEFQPSPFPVRELCSFTKYAPRSIRMNPPRKLPRKYYCLSSARCFVANISHSRLRDSRSAKGRKEEARPSQGAQEAGLGQALMDLTYREY